jgi:hypothetical protein
MSAIHLSGNAWINCLYVSVSVSCESMIGYTADLGRMLIDAGVITCSTHVLQRYLMYGLFRPVVTMPSIGRWFGYLLPLYAYLGMRVEHVSKLLLSCIHWDLG